MKKLLLFIVAITIVMATSCRHPLNDPFGEWTELTGNEELPTITDTVSIIDTVSVIDTVFVDNVIVEDSIIYITVTDTVTVVDTINNETIVVDTVVVETVFDCFGINKNGNIVATSTDGDDYTISYNVTVELTGDKFFAQPSEEPFKLDKTSASFDDDRAYFKVSKGDQEYQLPVYVRGANSVIINDELIEPCTPFSVSATVNAKPDTEFNGKLYETAEVTYVFRNGENESIATASQRVYAPKPEGEEPEQPEVNERLVTIEHTTQGGVLVVTGTIDNSLYGDTIAEVMIPLSLAMECQNKIVVEGNSFNFSVNGGCFSVNSQVVNTFQSENNGMVVEYETVEETFHQDYSACGNVVTAEQKVVVINNFNVSFGGETREIVIPLTVSSGAPTIGSVEVVANEAHKLSTVPYTATMAGLTASASQEVEMIIKAICFDGQRVIEAYRTLSTNSHTSWFVYDCVLTETTDGADHYYHYREIVNGVEGTWVTEKLTDDEYAFITNKAYFNGHGRYGLAIYYHKNYAGPFVGVVTDDIGSSYNEVVYHAFGKEQKTVTASRFAVFGELNTAIAGSSVEENGLIKMTCQEVTLNESQVLSNAGVVYFY